MNHPLAFKDDVFAEALAAARAGRLLWRGLRLEPSETGGSTGICNTHKRRRPRSMPVALSDACDDWFAKRFGWMARSNHALFVTGSQEQATQFGTPVVVLPLAPARYVWSPRVADLTQHLSGLCVTDPRDVPDVLYAADYRDRDLDDAIASGNEIMVRCNKFRWSLV